jgi:hypothetical protein
MQDNFWRHRRKSPGYVLYFSTSRPGMTGALLATLLQSMSRGAGRKR